MVSCPPLGRLHLIFLTFSNGFKAGSVNQNPRLSVNNQLYKPEYNQNIDIGYRFKNDKSSLNITAFYMNRKDLQVSLSSQQEATNPNSFYFYTSNASNGYNTGLNLDFNIISDNNFESYLNLGLLKTKIDAYDYMINETTIITFDSREAAHAPSYTLSWGFTKYHKNINYGLNVESKDKFYFSDSHNEESEPYSIANIHFDYQELQKLFSEHLM